MAELYLCDPARHIECAHTGCARWGRGDCFQTKNPDYAQRNERGSPIVTYRDDAPADGVRDGAFQGVEVLPDRYDEEDGIPDDDGPE